MVTSLPCRVLAVSLVAQLATALVAPQQRHRQLHHRSGRRLSLDVRMAGLSPLPGGISPYAKALKADVQGEIRSTSFGALQRATADGVQLAELEWPPLLGGAKGKSQLDDFTNIDVLDAVSERRALEGETTASAYPPNHNRSPPTLPNGPPSPPPPPPPRASRTATTPCSSAPHLPTGCSTTRHGCGSSLQTRRNLSSPGRYEHVWGIRTQAVFPVDHQ